MKSDYLNKTLEELENEVWTEPDFPTNLVKTIYSLRKKILKDYTVEDLRISIGQNVALPFLIPLAIIKLKENILAEGDFYPGDLLNNILTSDKVFWRTSKKNWDIIIELYKRNKQKFKTEKQIRKNFEDFILLHEHN